MIEYKLEGRIETNYAGMQQLVNFYKFASKYNNCWFNLNIENLLWFDANLSSVLFLYCHLLKKNNNLKFFIDYSSLKGDLNVLSRNGFAYHIVEDKKSFVPYDDRETVIPIKAFKVENADSFVTYIDNLLIKHRGLGNIKFKDKERIKSSYFEIFDNVGIHANSTTPVFACGQYFPGKNELKFSLTDFGDGFLYKIAKHTVGKENIKHAREAIDWAVKGNSSKENNIKGGNGLKKILTYCLSSGGSLQIVSDGCYWALENRAINTFKLNNHTRGTTIHLIFRYITE
jgi:hypothetical protein